jgi:signal transduction histidine kinase
MSRGRLRILLVEDSGDDEHLIRAELRRHTMQWELVRVEDREAFERALPQGWDVILADYQLPSFDAPEALELLKASGQDIPFIVVSGSVGEDIAVHMMKSGAADYFRKENMRRLVPAIQREVAERAQRERRRRLEAERDALLDNERRLRAEAERARSEAERANRLKDEFLATLSHELRTPLNAMLGWAHLLRQGGLPPDRQERALETIERNAKSQAKLIDDLLDISRIIAGKLVLQLRDVALAPVIDTALDAIKPAADAKHIALLKEIDSAVGPVPGEAERLQQVVWNLLSNAIKFTPEAGAVTVRLLRRDDRAVLEVSDTGQGITPEFLPHVFDRFRQEDGSTTRRAGGLGLGLAITRHLVELHGGTIRVTSQGEGQGATFTVTLPMRQVEIPADESKPARGGPASRLRGLRILVVDDEADARELIANVLGLEGADVRTAASGKEALRLVEDWGPQVLVSDIGMPGMSGYDFIKAVRALPPERGGWVPAAALTAYASAEDRHRAMLAGYQMHISKPVDPERLVRVVADLAGWSKHAQA